MATGSEFTNIVPTRLLGSTDFGTRFMDYMRESARQQAASLQPMDAVLNTALALAANGTDKFQVTGSSLAVDGLGHLLDITQTVRTLLQFENTVAIPYHVGLKYNTRPAGVAINPRTGLPEYTKQTEIIGEKAAPTAVVDNGNGTLTFTVTGVTESGVSNAGRQVLVYKNTLAEGATAEATAIETLVVAFSGGLNKITTVGLLGQSALGVSTTAADYTVVLLGPTVKRNTDLSAVSGYCYLGTVTGAGAGIAPSTFNITNQRVSAMSALQLDEITRIAGNGRMKVDVKAISGESGEAQIRVKNAAGTVVWSVDEAGNMTVSGTTTQQNVVQVNSSETITDSLNAGDNAADTHKIRGTWSHRNGADSSDFFKINGTTGLMQSLDHEPLLDGTYSLGSLTKRWANLYTEDLTFTGDFLPLVDNAQDLGSAVLRWQDLYARHIIVDAVTLNAHGVEASANGTGNGVVGVGGATGRGGNFTGGATSGAGIFGTAVGGNSSGVGGQGFGSGSGGNMTGGATGPGVTGVGGATSGVGGNFTASAGNSGGVTAAGNGTGFGIQATAGATGTGVVGLGGATSGAGGTFTAQAGNSNGATGTATGSGTGIVGTGGSSAGAGGTFNAGTGGQGLNATGNGVGNGVNGAGGTTSGNGVSGTVSAGTGSGVLGTANGGSGAGVKGQGNGSLFGGSFSSQQGSGVQAISSVWAAGGSLTNAGVVATGSFAGVNATGFAGSFNGSVIGTFNLIEGGYGISATSGAPNVVRFGQRTQSIAFTSLGVYYGLSAAFDFSGACIRLLNTNSYTSENAAGVPYNQGSVDGTGQGGFAGTARMGKVGGLFNIPATTTMFFLDTNVDSGGVITQRKIRQMDTVTRAVTTLLSGAVFNDSGAQLWGNGTDVYYSDGTSTPASEQIRKTTYPGAVTTTFKGTGTINALITGMWGNATDIYCCLNNHTIIKIAYPGAGITVIGGTAGAPAFADGTGTAASFSSPAGITGNATDIYVCDTGNNRIRKMVIGSLLWSTFAGSGAAATTNNTGTSAAFNGPNLISINPAGSILAILENSRQIYRELTVPGAVATTPAGTTVGGASGGSTTDARSAGVFNATLGESNAAVDALNLTGFNYAARISGATSAVNGLIKAALWVVPQNTPQNVFHDIGAMYVTTAGVLKICTVAGTPGTFVSVGTQT